MIDQNTALESKVCFKCGKLKPLSEFYTHKYMKDGHLNKCKECTKSDVRVFRIEHPENMRVAEDNKKKNPYFWKKMSVKSHEWRGKNPDKYRAQNAVNNAVRDGRLVKPDHCEVCGVECNPHAHHYDYSLPLNVVWCCPKCHRDLHHQNN